MNEVRALTGLRFVAALGVVLCHFAEAVSLPRSTRFLTDFGGSFVALFFVLSGFVLTLNVQRMRAQGTPRWLRRYAVERVSRIAPPYWLALGLAVASAWALDPATSATATTEAVTPEASPLAVDLTSLTLHALALQAWVPDAALQQQWNAPGWSVSSEVFFYLCLPLLLCSGRLRGTWSELAGLYTTLVAALLAYFIAAAGAGGPAIDGPLPIWYPVRCPLFGVFCFLFGVSLGLMRLRGALPTARAVSAPRLAMAFGAALAMAWFCHQAKQLTSWGVALEILAIYAVYTPSYCALIIYLVQPMSGPSPSGRLLRWLSSDNLVRLGQASYGLYLLHWTALRWVEAAPAAQRSTWAAIAIALTIALSVMLLRVFETPMKSRLRRLLLRD